MFCAKCGKPTEGDLTLCPECMAQQPAQAVTPPAPEVQPAMDLNLEGEAPVEKKKSKKNIAIISIAAILVVAIAVALICFLPSASTKSAKQAALDVEEKALADGNLLSAYYGFLSGTSRNANLRSQMAFTLELGDPLMELMQQSMTEEEAAILGEEFLQLFQKIGLVMDVNTDGDLSQLDLSLNLNKTDILALRAIIDMLSGNTYVGIPEMSDEYLTFDFQSLLAVDVTSMFEAMSQSVELSQALVDSLPAQADFDAMVEKYIMLILSNVDDVKKSTETMEADDMEQSFTVYTYTIDQASAIKIAKAVLTEAQHDETLQVLVKAYCDYYNSYTQQMYDMNYNLFYDQFDQMGMGEDFEDLYGYETVDADAFFESIPQLIEQLEDAEEEDDSTLILKTYADKSGNICGRAITDSEGEIDLTYITITKGNQKAFELTVDVGFTTMKFNGTGTVKNGKLSGDYALRAMGQVLLKVELEDFNAEAGTGTIRLGLGKALQQQLEALEEENPLVAMLGTNIQLELTLQEQGLRLGMLLGGQELIAIGLAGEEKEPFDVAIPDRYIDAMDEEALQAWLGKLDFNSLIDNLESAGAPGALIDALRELDLNALFTESFNQNEEEVIFNEDTPNANNAEINFNELIAAA